MDSKAKKEEKMKKAHRMHHAVLTGNMEDLEYCYVVLQIQPKELDIVRCCRLALCCPVVSRGGGGHSMGRRRCTGQRTAGGKK